MAGIGGAVVVARSPDAARIVARLPMVTRAVLALRAAGFAEVAAVGSGGIEEARRRLAVRWLASAAEAQEVAWPDPVLVVTADTLFDGAVFAPLLARAMPGVLRRADVATAAGTAGQAVVCPGPRVPAVLAALEAAAASWVEAFQRAQAPATAVRGLGPGLLVPLDAAHP